jgi:pimeloyl-ACP methyl ester carboxylesterase
MRQVLILLICAMALACAPEPVERPVAEATAAPQGGRATVASADGVPIAYTAQGQGDPALVFIHGGFCDATFWSEQVDVFARDYRIVTLDLAGHGASGSERPAWTMEAYGHDVKAVVEELALERLVLIGHSMGGPVSLAAAQLMPERVAGIIAVDTLQNMDFEWDEEAWQARMDAFREDLAGACQGMVQNSFREDADPQLVATVLAKLCDEPPAAGTALLEMFSFYDMAAQVQAVRAPIRALNSDLWPTNVEGNRKYAPGYEAVIMEGTGHFLMLERPEEFNRHLAELIRGLIQAPEKRG